MGLSLPKSNLFFKKKCLDKWVHFTVRITGEMVKDFCDCSRKAYAMSGKDCDTCSWGDLTIGDVGMCEMDEVIKAVGKWEVPDE